MITPTDTNLTTDPSLPIKLSGLRLNITEAEIARSDKESAELRKIRNSERIKINSPQELLRSARENLEKEKRKEQLKKEREEERRKELVKEIKKFLPHLLGFVSSITAGLIHNNIQNQNSDTKVLVQSFAYLGVAVFGSKIPDIHKLLKSKKIIDNSGEKQIVEASAEIVSAVPVINSNDSHSQEMGTQEMGTQEMRNQEMRTQEMRNQSGLAIEISSMRDPINLQSIQPGTINWTAFKKDESGISDENRVFEITPASEEITHALEITPASEEITPTLEATSASEITLSAEEQITDRANTKTEFSTSEITENSKDLSKNSYFKKLLVSQSANFVGSLFGIAIFTILKSSNNDDKENNNDLRFLSTALSGATASLLTSCAILYFDDRKTRKIATSQIQEIPETTPTITGSRLYSQMLQPQSR